MLSPTQMTASPTPCWRTTFSCSTASTSTSGLSSCSPWASWAAVALPSSCRRWWSCAQTTRRPAVSSCSCSYSPSRDPDDGAAINAVQGGREAATVAMVVSGADSEVESVEVSEAASRAARMAVSSRVALGPGPCHQVRRLQPPPASAGITGRQDTISHL